MSEQHDETQQEGEGGTECEPSSGGKGKRAPHELIPEDNPSVVHARKMLNLTRDLRRDVTSAPVHDVWDVIQPIFIILNLTLKYFKDEGDGEDDVGSDSACGENGETPPQDPITIDAADADDRRPLPPPPRSDPLVLDLDGDGVETSGYAALFDHDANGFAELTKWVGQDDGLLAWDRNGDGVINDGTELFGDQTELKNGQKAANGFEALQELDSNSDGVVDSRDEHWADLRVWRRKAEPEESEAEGADGSSDEGRLPPMELLALETLNIQSLRTAYTDSEHTDEHGNQHRQRGSYVLADGTVREMADVWLETAPHVSVHLEPVIHSEAVAALPDLGGMGTVRNLRDAMELDSSGGLRQLVTQFTEAKTDAARRGLLDAIIFKWTGSEGVTSLGYGAPGGRTMLIDPRELAALEALAGRPWLDESIAYREPGFRVASTLQNDYQNIREGVYAALLAQEQFKDVFEGLDVIGEEENRAWNFTGVEREFARRIAESPNQGIEDLSSFYSTLWGQGFISRGWNPLEYLGRYLSSATMTDDLQEAMRSHRMQAVATSGEAALTASWATLFIFGDARANALTGTRYDNTLLGAAGNDALQGGAGSDTYIFNRGDGADTIDESTGYYRDRDTIRFGVGITEENIRLSRVREGGTDLLIEVLDTAGEPTGDSITVKRQFSDSVVQVEELVFNDGSTLSYREILSQVPLQGTEGGDVLTGDVHGELIRGGAGDDTINGGTGGDTYVFNLLTPLLRYRGEAIRER